MELDFSKLENISYRGIDGETEKKKKDELIEKGFTIVEGEETPFSDRTKEGTNKTAAEQKKPLKRKLEPLESMDGRNYRAIYREVCNFHDRHNPPRLDDDNGVKYWTETAEDMGRIAAMFEGDSFIVDLLTAVYEELEREYKIIAG